MNLGTGHPPDRFTSYRLVYLSISPDLYPSVAKSVAEHLRPSSSSNSSSSPNDDAWLRVVFEKPFGRVRGGLLGRSSVWGRPTTRVRTVDLIGC